MDAPYAWHPGARCVNPRWPLTPHLLPDELLSSWMTRTALAHGCTMQTLTVITPGSRPWLGDFDRGLSPAHFGVLCTQSGLSPQAVLASTLRPIAQRVNEPRCLRSCGTWPWILVIGCRGSARAGGLQCCPLCMSGAQPYYPIQARLAWHTGCAVHECQLIDRCPNCLSALQPELTKPGNSLELCHRCLAPMRDAPCIRSTTAAMMFQEHVDAWGGRSLRYGRQAMSFSDWMFVARVMVSLVMVLIRQQSRSSIKFCRLMELEGYAETKPSAIGLPFEFLSPADRSGLLAVVWAIMQAGPDRFIKSALGASLSASAIVLPVGRPVPAVLSLMVSALARRPHGVRAAINFKPRDPSSVLRMWERLQRRIRRDGIR